MPFNNTQAVLKKVLPKSAFEWLYRIATVGYYAKQGIADWLYYNIPRRDREKQLMIDLITEILPYTMVGRGGLIATFKAVKDIEKREVEGCLVECGVARGGSATLMLATSTSYRDVFLADRKAWLFDSFEGLPEPTEEDGVLRKPRGENKASWDLAEGHCLGTQGEVEWLLFDALFFSRGSVHLVKGWFQDTLLQYREEVGDIAVLRIDGDWYESTKCCLENLYDSVVEGGYVILDDYALVGCRKAVDEFFECRGEEMPEIMLDGRGGGYFVK